MFRRRNLFTINKIDRKLFEYNKQNKRKIKGYKIHPCILAFRPSENSEFENLEECDTKSFYDCSKYAAQKMIEEGLDIFKNEGCLLCEYCTIIHDLTREILRRN